MNYRQLLVLPIAAILGSASVEPANAHTTRQGDNGGTELITEVNPPLVKVTNSKNGETVEVTVNCAFGRARFQFEDGDSIEWVQTWVEENVWIYTGTWKNGRSITSYRPPPVIVFACHTH